MRLRHHYFLRIALFLWIVSLLCAGPTFGQIGVPDLLSSQFDGRDHETGQRLWLLQEFRGPRPKPSLTWTAEDDLTVHTDRGAQGVIEDLHANGSVLSGNLKFSSARAVPQIFFREQTLSESGYVNENSTQLNVHSHLEQPEIRLLWPSLKRGTLSLGYGQTRFTANGDTNLYKNVFGIFTKTPPFRLVKYAKDATLDMTYPLTSSWSAEASFSSERSPGDLTLFEPGQAVTLTLPLGDHGLAQAYALQDRASSRLVLTAYGATGTFQGDSAVTREADRAIGTASAGRHHQAIGLGGQLAFGGSRHLGLYYEYVHDTWHTEGFVPDPAQVGISATLAADLRYHAQYDIAQRQWGINWEQAYRGQKNLHLGYRWIALDATGEGDFAFHTLLLPVGGSGAIDGSGLHAHYLEIRCEFPFARRWLGEIGASQIIPVAKAGVSSGSGGGSGGTSAPRTTTGGWELTWRITLLL